MAERPSRVNITATLELLRTHYPELFRADGRLASSQLQRSIESLAQRNDVTLENLVALVAPHTRMMGESVAIEDAVRLVGLSRGDLQDLVHRRVILGEVRDNPRFWRVNRESLWDYVEKLDRDAGLPSFEASLGQQSEETSRLVSSAALISSRLPLEQLLRLETLLATESEIGLTAEEAEELRVLREQLQAAARIIWANH